MENTEKKLDYGKGLLIILLSITWLVYQIYLFNNDSQFSVISQRICEMIGHNSQMEWRRGCEVLAYITSSVPLIHIYLLIVLLPRLFGHQFKHFYYIFNGILSGVFLFLSLLVIPQFVVRIFPEMANTPLQESVKYWNIVYVNIFLALGSLLLIFLVKILGFIKKSKYVLKFSELFKSLIRYLITILFAVFVSVIQACILSLVNRYYPSTSENLLRWLTNYAPLFMGNIAILICAPLIEEIAFRGFIFRHADKNLPTWFAILFSSVCWGIWHRDLAQFLYIVPLGILLAIIFKQTDRLRYPILIHFISNFIANCSFLSEANNIYKIPQLSFIWEYRLLIFDMPIANILGLLIGSLLIILCLLWIFPRFFPKPEKEA